MKRETDPDREYRVVRAVIDVSKTHQDLLPHIAQAAVSARHMRVASYVMGSDAASSHRGGSSSKRDEQIQYAGSRSCIAPCRVYHCETSHHALQNTFTGHRLRLTQTRPHHLRGQCADCRGWRESAIRLLIELALQRLSQTHSSPDSITWQVGQDSRSSTTNPDAVLRPDPRRVLQTPHRQMALE